MHTKSKPKFAVVPAIQHAHSECLSRPRRRTRVLAGLCLPVPLWSCSDDHRAVLRFDDCLAEIWEDRLTQIRVMFRYHVPHYHTTSHSKHCECVCLVVLLHLQLHSCVVSLWFSFLAALCIFKFFPAVKASCVFCRGSGSIFYSRVHHYPPQFRRICEPTVQMAQLDINCKHSNADANQSDAL